jgi:dihydroorotate dehydrogenase
MLEFINSDIALELNLSCPNVSNSEITDVELSLFVKKFPTLQVKVVPTSHPDIERFKDLGIKTIHMSNTIPTAKGGISGRQLKETNLPLVEHAANRGLIVIAGGGIYSAQDVEDYRNAGADHFSISTAFFSRPYNIPQIYKCAVRHD